MPLRLPDDDGRNRRQKPRASALLPALTGLVMLATACLGALLLHLALKALVEAPLGHPRILDCNSFATGAAGHPQRTQARACHIIEAIGAT